MTTPSTRAGSPPPATGSSARPRPAAWPSCSGWSPTRSARGSCRAGRRRVAVRRRPGARPRRDEDAVSYGLKLLRTAGLVTFRKDGRVIYYRLARRLPAPARRALPAPAADHLARHPRGRAVSAAVRRRAARARGRRRDDVGDPVGADPRVHAVRGRPGRRPAVDRSCGTLGDDRPRTLAVATGLGAASSSCSYAAVALARSLFRKGASFTAAMAFEIASTNLVIELGIIMALLLGLAVHPGRVRRRPDHDRARRSAVPALPAPAADRRRPRAGRPRLAGSMEGHAAMDMSVQGDGSVLPSAAFPGGVHLGLARLRDGVGGGPARHRDRAARSPGPSPRGCRMSSGRACSSPTTRCGPSLGAARRPARRRARASSARSATCRWRRCCGTAASASAA